MKRGWLFLEDGEWKQADEYFDRVLDIDPEYAKAYVGKLCVELKVIKEDDLMYQEVPFDEDTDYKKAMRFSDKAYRDKLINFASSVKTRWQKN